MGGGWDWSVDELVVVYGTDHIRRIGRTDNVSYGWRNVAVSLKFGPLDRGGGGGVWNLINIFHSRATYTSLSYTIKRTYLDQMLQLCIRSEIIIYCNLFINMHSKETSLTSCFDFSSSSNSLSSSSSCSMVCSGSSTPSGRPKCCGGAQKLCNMLSTLSSLSLSPASAKRTRSSLRTAISIIANED